MISQCVPVEGSYHRVCSAAVTGTEPWHCFTERKMMMKGIVVLLCMVLTCVAQKWNQGSSRREPKGHANGKTCSNLTQVLDNWKYAILTQVKELLINDHVSVLPEYNRIRPLSEALGDLYMQFNTLKDELRKLTSKLDSVEGFVDDLQDGRFARPQRPQRPPSAGLRSPLRAQMRTPDRGMIKGPPLRRRSQIP
ncbi:hypothetical protein EYF80_018246 [Liparis tanakae]|uniref:Uncharacterized protein n=1 Tax=Liparis tanakae TaxID=230148 RepID=A0A4Z2I176_9TELE|nr:hypothetical protein EYF80_018246 [Liparis tanakae]